MWGTTVNKKGSTDPLERDGRGVKKENSQQNFPEENRFIF